MICHDRDQDSGIYKRTRCISQLLAVCAPAIKKQQQHDFADPKWDDSHTDYPHMYIYIYIITPTSISIWGYDSNNWLVIWNMNGL